VGAKIQGTVLPSRTRIHKKSFGCQEREKKMVNNLVSGNNFMVPELARIAGFPRRLTNR
jgi:hypothetical protein